MSKFLGVFLVICWIFAIGCIIYGESRRFNTRREATKIITSKSVTDEERRVILNDGYVSYEEAKFILEMAKERAK